MFKNLLGYIVVFSTLSVFVACFDEDKEPRLKQKPSVPLDRIEVFSGDFLSINGSVISMRWINDCSESGEKMSLRSLGNGVCDASLNCEVLAGDLGDCADDDFVESCLQIGENEVRCHIGWFYPGLGRWGFIETRDLSGSVVGRASIDRDAESECQEQHDGSMLCTWLTDSNALPHLPKENTTVSFDPDNYLVEHYTYSYVEDFFVDRQRDYRVELNFAIDRSYRAYIQNESMVFSEECEVAYDARSQSFSNTCQTAMQNFPFCMGVPCFSTEPLDDLSQYEPIIDCENYLVTVGLLNDGICQQYLNCEAHNFDGGDCSSEEEDWLSACGGQNVPAWWVADGFCDDELNCATHNFDGGDCSSQEEDWLSACDGENVPTWWLGDGECDASLNCEAFHFDDEDCGARTQE
jgi:hypothetical protein